MAACKLYTTKTPITAADLLNDPVLPMLEENGIGLLRILTDRGTEFCGRPERHDYPLYLAVNDIEHTRAKAYSPQTNGICERFHRTVKEEFYEIAFRKKVYSRLDDLQADLDAWVDSYNYERTHQGKMCCGRTPMQTLRDGRELWEAKVSSLNLSDNCTTVRIDNCQIGSRLSQLEVRLASPLGVRYRPVLLARFDIARGALSMPSVR